ncbi:MAG TPA: TnsA endonuclease N-terminal domain-containing protein [Symbiobacteriaceae bacterium]|nr:TnsA endonuclease N-terminal domain-containing protein [Symbiobacteriaceae bacterium]
MLNSDQFEKWCNRMGFTSNVRSMVEQIRSSQPTRHVQSSRQNVSGRYPSRKMGVTIQFESHKVELAGIFEMEHDPKVLEYYDQPSPIPLRYQAATGKSIAVMSTPDFFVLRQDSAGWEEWKPEEELLKLSQKQPNRYVRGSDGSWICPPGQSFAEHFGLYYRLRSDRDIDWTLQRNLIFLEDYFRLDSAIATEHSTKLVLTKVESQPGITLAALFREVDGVSRDHLFAMIASDTIFVDLRSAPLARPEDVRIFPSAESAEGHRLALSAPHAPLPGTPTVLLEPGVPLKWDDRAWRVLNVGTNQVTLMDDGGSAVELPRDTLNGLIRGGTIQGIDRKERAMSPAANQRFLEASQEDLQVANMRFHAIHRSLSQEGEQGQEIPARTLRLWKSQFKRAEKEYGCGYVGLLPRTSSKGNRNAKIPDESVRVMKKVIEEHYLTPKNRRVKSVYSELVRVCETRGVYLPSLATFYAEIKRHSSLTRIRRREGNRAAYSHEPFYWTLESTTPRHGDRPFEIGHIDHTELDIELVCSRTGKNLGRPWATLMADAFSRRILAVYLSFDPPSYRSCMMVIRICVQRHGRIPQNLVVDGGPEFGSTYFETLLARYEITKKQRPPAKARFGSVVERLFGTSNSMFVHNLSGNTQVMRNVRQVTKSVNPKRLACWTLPSLYEALCTWCYEVYDSLSHPSLGQSPQDAFVAGLAAYGHRSHKLIPFDDSFKMLTMPSTTKGAARVQPGRGVKINHLYYWPESSSIFLNPEVENSSVPVRFDPFDCGTAYAYVQGRWIKCLSEHFKEFQGRTEREVHLATEELRKALRNHSAESVTVTARKLADFLASTQAEETLQLHRLRDTEFQRVLSLVNNSQSDHPSEQPTGQVVQFSRDRRPSRDPKPQSENKVTPWGLPPGLKPYEEYD